MCARFYRVDNGQFNNWSSVEVVNNKNKRALLLKYELLISDVSCPDSDYKKKI